MKSLLNAAILAVAVSVSLTPAFAVDIITKKSTGKRVNGTISAMSKTELSLKKNQGEPEIVAANDIAVIEWDGGGASLNLGYSDENSGRYDSATQNVQKAKSDAKSPSDFLRGEYEYVLARIAGKQGLADPEKRAAAIQKLIAAQKAYPDHVRYYESLMLLGHIQLVSKDYDAVRATIQSLSQAPWNDYKLASRIIESRVLVSEGKIDEAIAGFEAVATADGDSSADKSRKYEAMLGHARGLILQSKFDAALAILETIPAQVPSDDIAIQAEAHILQGQAFQGLGQLSNAVLAYMKVDLLFSKDANYHPEALYQLSNLWKLVQLPERSAEAAGKLAQMYPNSEWRKKLGGE